MAGEGRTTVVSVHCHASDRAQLNNINTYHRLSLSISITRSKGDRIFPSFISSFQFFKLDFPNSFVQPSAFHHRASIDRFIDFTLSVITRF